jgi:hypothetical protein
MSHLYAGCLVEVLEDAEHAPHPLEGRGLEKGDRFQVQTVRQGNVIYTSMHGLGKISADKVKVVETVGGETSRDDLRIDRCRSNEWFVYRHSDNMILCQGVDAHLAPFKMYRPLVWGEYRQAEKWVNEGCFADLQESLGNLDIRFTKVMVVARR